MFQNTFTEEVLEPKYQAWGCSSVILCSTYNIQSPRFGSPEPQTTPPPPTTH